MPPPRGAPYNILEGPGDYDVTPTVHNDTYPALQTANLAGKACFVSGGSRGVGRAMVLSFARAGASRIAAAARNIPESLAADVAAAAKSRGHPEPKFLAVKMDATVASDVEAAAALVGREFGGSVDVVVNNAAILGVFGEMAEIEPDAWWRTMEVNVRGPFLVARSFLPLLCKDAAATKGEKFFFNISSVGALLHTPGGSAYQISKTALVKLSGHIQSEYGEKGITCLSIHPGNIMTDMTADVQGEMRKVFTETPEISADTISYIVSQKLDWLGGRYINVTWDMPELLAKRDEIVKQDKLKIQLSF